MSYRYVFPTPDGSGMFDFTTSEPKQYAIVVGPDKKHLLHWGVVSTWANREHAIEVAQRTRAMPVYGKRVMKVVQLPEPSAPKVEQSAGGARRGSHADCDHENTSAERRACRARRATV